MYSFWVFFPHNGYQEFAVFWWKDICWLPIKFFMRKFFTLNRATKKSKRILAPSCVSKVWVILTSEIQQWLQKVCLEELTLEYPIFFRRLLVFKDINILERTRLFGKLPFLVPIIPFLTFKTFVHVSILFLRNCYSFLCNSYSSIFGLGAIMTK